MKFQGVPAGKIKVVPVPSVVFSELLPAIDDLAELQVTLHVYYLQVQKKGTARLVTEQELSEDMTLMRALEFKKENLRRGIDKAVARGSLLAVESGAQRAVMFNTPESRRVIEQLQAGGSVLALDWRPALTPVAERPNIFKLYEQHIGALTPLIGEELKEAETDYPAEVIEQAFRIAVENNARKWSYVRAILQNWARDGSLTLRSRYEKAGRNRRGEPKPAIRGKLANVNRTDK